MKLRFEAVRGHIEAFDDETGDFLFSADRFSEALEEAELYQSEALERSPQASSKDKLWRDEEVA